MPELAPLPDPAPSKDERELLLAWLGHLRTAIVRKLADLDEAQARWAPDGALIPLLGIVNHLTHVEWRWTDGQMLGAATSRGIPARDPPSARSRAAWAEPARRTTR